MAVDGTLKFDTKIDTDGVENGVSSVKDVIKKLISSLENLAGAVTKAFNNINVDEVAAEVKDVEQSIDSAADSIVEMANDTVQATAQAEASVEQLDNALDNITITRWDDAEKAIYEVAEVLEEIETQAIDTSQAINEVAIESRDISQEVLKIDDEPLEEMSDTSVELNNMLNLIKRTFQFMPAVIGTVGERIKNAFSSDKTEMVETENEIQQLVDKIDTYRDAITSMEGKGLYFGDQEYDEAYRELSSMEQKLKDYKKELTSIDGEQKKVSKSADKASKNATKVGSSMKNSEKKAGKFSKTLGMLGKSLMFSIVFRAFSAVTNAIKEGFQNLAQYSPQANKSISALATSLQTLKNSFATAFSPILTAITPALQTLINYISQAVTTLGQFFAVLFTGSSTFVKAKDAVVDYAGSLADASKEANKALSPIDKLNVVTDSSSSSNTSTPNVSDMFEEVTIDSKIVNMVSRLKDALKPTIDALADLNKKLDPLKNFVAQGLIDFYNSFLLPVGTWVVGDGIPRLVKAIGNLLGDIDWRTLNDAMKKFWEALAPFAIDIGKGLLEFIDGLTDGIKPFMSTAIRGLAGGLDILAEAINSLDPRTTRELALALGSLFTALAITGGLSGIAGILSKIGLSLKGLGTSLGFLAVFNPTTLTVFFGNLVGDLDNFIATKLEEMFGPVGKKIIVVLGNAIMGGAGGFAFGGPIGAVIGALITGFIATIYEFSWDKVWKAIKKGLTDSVNFVFNFNQTKAIFSDMVQNFKDALSGEDIGKNLIKGLFNGIKGTLMALLEPIIDLFSPITDGVKKLFGIHSPSKVFYEIGEFLINGLINGVKSLINKVPEYFKELSLKIKEPFTNVQTWFKTKFDDAFKNVKSAFSTSSTWANDRKNDIQNAFISVPEWFGTKFNTVWSNIKSTFENNGVKDWFTSKREEIKDVFKTIPDWFKNIFTQAWNGVKNVFSTGGKIFDGIKDGIGETFKSVVNKLIEGINRIIEIPFNKINGMLNSIRNINILGAKPFGGLWTQNPISTPKIPKLATGAVIPPNSEFLAILGDQKKGTNIEAPLDTIVEAFKAVVGSNGSGNGTDLHLHVYEDGKLRFEQTVRYEKENYNRTGKSVFVH